jgi:hypothetical protein
MISRPNFTGKIPGRTFPGKFSTGFSRKIFSRFFSKKIQEKSKIPGIQMQCDPIAVSRLHLR